MSAQGKDFKLIAYNDQIWVGVKRGDTWVPVVRFRERSLLLEGKQGDLMTVKAEGVASSE
jgi:hypothetical protein